MGDVGKSLGVKVEKFGRNFQKDEKIVQMKWIGRKTTDFGKKAQKSPNFRPISRTVKYKQMAIYQTKIAQ